MFINEINQIYGTQYAINEQPADNGTLKLGVIFATDGEYTISAIRNDIGQVILKDKETGMMTDLQQHGYTFDADAGISNSRFTLSFGNATAISTMANSPAAEKEVYTLDGSKIGNSTIGLKKGVYVVRNGQRNQKVIVK